MISISDALSVHHPIGTGVGRRHGTSYTAPFDRWFRYPAGFASDYAKLLLDRIEVKQGTVVDCFAGSGVTGTAAQAKGLGFYGIEAHPLIAELARLKFSRIDPSTIQAFGIEVAAAGRAGTATPNAHEVGGVPHLIERSFTPEVLSSLQAMRDYITTHKEAPGSLHAKWALLATLRDVASVKVGWPYQRPGVARKPRHADPVSRFCSRLSFMVDDIAGAPPAGTATVVTGDSREAAAWKPLEEPAIASISSPPYLNNFDYADATRLELYFWGEITSWSSMTKGVRDGMVTASTQQSSKAEMASALEALKALDSSAAVEIQDLVSSISGSRSARGGRTKEYDQVAPAYFASMFDILRHLYANLATGGTALWLVGDSAPYGVYVDTPAIIGRLAEDCGFTFAEDIRLRDRGARWTANKDRHDVPLSERMIVLRK